LHGITDYQKRNAYILFFRFTNVESYQTELATVKNILKENPRGMTISDISRKIKINRNSVAKYLDILLVSGHAELVAFGPAKVFFPSKRVPISTILNFISDIIIVIDKDLKIVQVNKNFLSISDLQIEYVIGSKINNLFKIFLKIPDLIPNIKNALNGKESTIATSIKNKEEELHFEIKHIPITLDNGEPGVGLIIEDVTRQIIAEKKFLNLLTEWNTTFNLVAEMISIHDNDLNIIKINKAFADFLHNTPEELIGKKCYEVIHGINKPSKKCACMQIKLVKKPVTIKFYEPFLDKNIEVTSFPIADENGEIICSINVFKDKSK